MFYCPLDCIFLKYNNKLIYRFKSKSKVKKKTRDIGNNLILLKLKYNYYF